MVPHSMTLSDPEFKVTTFLKLNVSKQRVLGTKLLQNINRKPCPVYRMVPCLVTLTDL